MEQQSHASAQFDAAALDQMEKIISDLGLLYHERNEALQEVARAHHEALLLLTTAAEYRDDDTGVHIVRIGFLTEALARLMGRPSHYAEQLRKAAPMHDIGKIGVPDCVLKKPGPLSLQERQVMSRHSKIGADMLGKSRIALFRMAAEIALTHHERWDGSGYPHGLAGTAIPLSGRLVAVVDFYDALTMNRVYRSAYTHAQALEMLAAEHGKAFDPAVVDCFLAHHEALQDLHRRISSRRVTFEDLIHGDHMFQDTADAASPANVL